MKYRKFIEENFLIDEPKSGKLVPFVFNDVQKKYYQVLVDEYDIENKGLTVPIREDILKARREGFSSLILALYAADDLLNDNATITQVISYKDDATKVFRRRYKTYILSFYAKRAGLDVEKDRDRIEKMAFKTMESGQYEHKHNQAKFICGTASARTGERGGVLQKVLFSEAAFYPDTENMTAKEIIEGTLRQVDIASGWAFIESTANGKGNYYHNLWQLSSSGHSRFRPRFYGWREFYSEEEYKEIAKEFTDKEMLKQEYPETPEEAFLSSGSSFTTVDKLKAMVGCTDNIKKLYSFLELKGTDYITQCEIIRDFIEQLSIQNPTKSFYIGIDVGKQNDSTVVTAIQEKIFSPTASIKCIAIDATGVGDFMPDWFENNSRWYVLRIKFSAQQKDALYKNLMTVIEKKYTELPDMQTEEYEKFFKQMLDLQVERKGELLYVHHPEGNYFDDYPDSWSLAETAYIHINGLPKQPSKPEQTEGFTSQAVGRLLKTHQINQEEEFEQESGL